LDMASGDRKALITTESSTSPRNIILLSKCIFIDALTSY
jgi:hypothetical protein